MTFRVLIADKLADEGIEILRKEAGVDVEDCAGITADELLKKVVDFEALIVRSRSKVTAAVIHAAKSLRIIGRAGIGVDNIDVDAATAADIVVINAPDGNSISAAEHTIAMMLALARHIPQGTASVRTSAWDSKPFMGRQLYHKTLGIIGLGHIGKLVAHRARGLGMRVVGYDPMVNREWALNADVDVVDLPELLRRSDVVTVHTPLNKDTKHMITHAQVEQCKDGVMFVNCARGGIYDERALLAGLKSNKIWGIALDVLEEEPPKKDSPLLIDPRVIFTPHLGASTYEAQVAVAEEIAIQFCAFARGESVKNSVNKK